MRAIDEILEEILSEMTDEEFTEKWSKVREKSQKGITVEEYFSQFESCFEGYKFGNTENDFDCSENGINEFFFAA